MSLPVKAIIQIRGMACPMEAGLFIRDADGMSIYTRSYMRGPRPGRPAEEWALKGLLIAMVTIFLLQNILRHWIGTVFMEDTFALSLHQLVEGKIYTLLTYGFLHAVDGGLPWHLVFNALMLYWFGRDIQARMGSEHFLECFLFCILTGGVIWSCLHFITGNPVSVVGASAGVFGLLYLFCRSAWDAPMSFLFIPLQFTGKQLFYILLGFQVFFLLFSELPGSGAATANSAHLGGVLGAFIYERKLLPLPSLIHLLRRLRPRPTAEIQSPKWQKRATAAQASTGGRYSVNTTDPGELRREVDRILDKINSKGFGSLSADEKKTLDQARDIL